MPDYFENLFLFNFEIIKIIIRKNFNDLNYRVKSVFMKSKAFLIYVFFFNIAMTFFMNGMGFSITI
jgi:hypothetical protein